MTRFLTEVEWPEDRVEQTRIGLILKRVQEEPQGHWTKIAMAQALIHLAYTILELASSLDGGLGKWAKDHAASIGAMCRQAAQDTVRCLILWVIKVTQAGVPVEALMSTLYGGPKLQVAESG